MNSLDSIHVLVLCSFWPEVIPAVLKLHLSWYCGFFHCDEIKHKFYFVEQQKQNLTDTYFVQSACLHHGTAGAADAATAGVRCRPVWHELPVAAKSSSEFHPDQNPFSTIVWNKSAYHHRQGVCWIAHLCPVEGRGVSLVFCICGDDHDNDNDNDNDDSTMTQISRSRSLRAARRVRLKMQKTAVISCCVEA